MADVNVGTITAEARLDNLISRELPKIARDIQRFQSSFSRLGIASARAGRALTVGVTAPIIGLGAASIAAASDFEDSFTGVLKTVDDAGRHINDLTESGQALQEQLKGLARELPFTTKEINGVAQAAGQMGVGTEEIAEFSRVMLELGSSTNLSAAEAGTALARLGAITGEQGVKAMRDMGDALVSLGNTMETQEAEILTFATQLSGVADVARLRGKDLLAFSAALTSVGIPAERGGTALRTMFQQMTEASIDGGEKLQIFADLVGKTTSQWVDDFGKEGGAAKAAEEFLRSMGHMADIGGNVFEVLRDLGLGARRTSGVILQIAGGADQLTRAFEGVGPAAAGALKEEFAKRLETFSAQMTIFKNRIGLVAVELGNALIPVVKDFTGFLERMLPALLRAADVFANLPSPIRNTMIAVALLAAALGPLTWGFGQLMFVAQGIFQVFPAMTGRFVAMAAASKTTAAAVTASKIPYAALNAQILAMHAGATLATPGISRLGNAVDNLKLVALAGGKAFIRLLAPLLSWPAAIAAAVVGVLALTGKLDDLWDILKSIGSIVINLGKVALRSLREMFMNIVEVVVDVLELLKDLVLRVPGADKVFAALSVGIAELKLELQDAADSLEMAADGLSEADLAARKAKTAFEAFIEETEGLVVSAASIGDVESALHGLMEQGGLSAEQMELVAKKALDLQKQGQPLSTALERIVDWYKALRAEGLGVFDPAITSANEAIGVFETLANTVEGIQGPQAPIGGIGTQFGGPSRLGSGNALNRGLFSPPMISDEAIRDLKEQYLDKVAGIGAFDVPFDQVAEFTGVVQKAEVVGHLFAKSFSETLKENMSNAFLDIGNIIVRAITGGGDIAGSIGASIGSSIGNTIGNAIAGQSAGVNAGGIAQAATGLGGGIAGSLVGGIVGGLVSFGIGTAISFGIKGLFKLFGSSFKKEAAKAGRDMGLTLSEEFIDALKKSGIKDAGVAIMSNLGAAIVDSGGVLQVGLAQSIKLTRDLFSFFERGQITIQTLGKEFNNMFGLLLPHAFNEATGEMADGFMELIALATRFGVGADAIAGFMDKIAARTEELNEELAGLQQELAELLTKAAKEGASAVGEFIEATSLKSAGQVQQAASLATRFFNELIAGGMSVAEVMALMGDDIKAIAERFEELGLEVPPMFQTLINLSGLFGDTVAGRAIRAAQAWSDAISSLNALGLVTQRDFNKFGNSIDRAFKRAIAGGASSEEAILANAPAISNLIRLQEEYGFKVDDETQKIIDQAKEMGITGDTGKSETEKQIEAIERLILKVEELIDRFVELAEEIGNLPTPDIDIEGARARGRAAETDAIPSAQTGAIVRKGGLVNVHGDELIAPIDQLGFGLGRGSMAFGGSRSTGHDDEVHQEIVGLRADMESLPDIISVALTDALVKSRVR